MSEFTINARVHAIVSFRVSADTLERALEIGRTTAHERPLFHKAMEYIDGSIEVIGADADWDLE